MERSGYCDGEFLERLGGGVDVSSLSTLGTLVMEISSLLFTPSVRQHEVWILGRWMCTQGDDAVDEATREEERCLTSILELTRRVYYEKGLRGSIEVSRTLTFYAMSSSCDINGSDAGMIGETQKLASGIEKKVMKALRSSMHTLQKRALVYRNKSYRQDLTLSCGVSMTDPVLGVISTSITCSATVTSLLASA